MNIKDSDALLQLRYINCKWIEVCVLPCRSFKFQQKEKDEFVELKAKCSWWFEKKNCPYILEMCRIILAGDCLLR